MKRYILKLFVILAVFWLLNSGIFSGLILSLGFASICLVVWLSYKMSVLDRESLPFYLGPKLIVYLLWLIKEIVISNVAVLKQIWGIGPPVTAGFRTIKISQKNDMGKVIFANSITLTPGTIAVDLMDDEILVHALDNQNIESEGMLQMDRLVSALEDQ